MNHDLKYCTPWFAQFLESPKNWSILEKCMEMKKFGFLLENSLNFIAGVL